MPCHQCQTSLLALDLNYLPVVHGVKLHLSPFRAIVRAVFPSPCGVRMDAPEGSFALIGEGRAKSSSDRIRKERAGKAGQAAPEKRRGFASFHVISSSLRLNR